MLEQVTEGWHRASRRRFLRKLAGTAIAGGLARTNSSWGIPLPTEAPPSFEEVSPAQSGISWTHTSGRSPMAHLPETVGPGCAFVDYDNDGWMDIYLVNSG